MRTHSLPFRWNMSNPSLGKRLGRGASVYLSQKTKDELLRCGAQVLRSAGDTELVFVGRSPENLYDMLSGALAETSWRDRVHLLQLSLRWKTPGTLQRQCPAAFAHLWVYFDALGLTPRKILERPRPVTFVDLVCSGGTFGNLVKVLWHWTGGKPGRWPRLRSRLRWVAIVERNHPTCEAWEAEDSEWTNQFPEESVQRVFLESRTWRYLAEEQPKTTDSYTEGRWGNPKASCPPEEEDQLEAARLGRALFKLGHWSRRRLASHLERPPTPKRWRGSLIRELWG